MIRALLVLLMLAGPAGAVQPDEILADPGLEARARSISRTIRCPVCQGESIDDSSAPISRDLRVIIRERLMAGDSDAEVTGFIVARYGEFVLFDPPATGINLILWGAGPAMLLAGLGVAFVTLRRRDGLAGLPGYKSADLPAALPDELSEAETADLNRILRRTPD